MESRQKKEREKRKNKKKTTSSLRRLPNKLNMNGAKSKETQSFSLHPLSNYYQHIYYITFHKYLIKLYNIFTYLQTKKDCSPVSIKNHIRFSQSICFLIQVTKKTDVYPVNVDCWWLITSLCYTCSRVHCYLLIQFKIV